MMDEIARNIMNEVQKLANVINTNYQILGNNLDAMLAALSTFEPEFQAVYDRALYMKKCITLFQASAQALSDGGPDALEFLAANNKAVELLKKEGKENGWLSTFHNAKQNVEKAERAAKLEVVEK